MSLQTPTGPRSGRSTPAGNMSAFSPPPSTNINGSPLAAPLEEGIPLSSPVVPPADLTTRASDSDASAHAQITPPSTGRPRSKSGSLPLTKGLGRFSHEAEPVHFAGGSFRSHRPYYREDYDDEYVPEHREPPSLKDYDRYWRGERPDRYTTRRRPSSRPPPAIFNRRPSNQEDFEDLRSHDDARSVRDPFDTPRRRLLDEEMGYRPETPDRPNIGRVLSNHNEHSRLPDWNALTTEEKVEVLRLPLTHWMHSDLKNHFVAALGEFVGTTMFLFFAFAGTEVANIQSSSSKDTTTGATTGFDVSTLLYISLCFGFSLMVNVWIFFRISGGLFNPAVTLAMAMVKAITLARAICLFIAQMLGSMLASVIVRHLFPESFNVRTTLGGGTSLVQGVFIEAILTAELVFTIFMLAKEKHRATFIAPVGIGLALFIAEMVGVQFTGGSLNPARSFGPCVISLTFEKEHWIYCKSDTSYSKPYFANKLCRGRSFCRVTHCCPLLPIYQNT